jgi:hypothetical protein
MKKSAAIKVLNGIGLGYGITSILAPGLLQRIYGSAQTTPELRQMTRLWGTTLVSLSAISATAGEQEHDRLLVAVGGGNALAAAVELAASATDGLPLKVALPGALTSAAVAGACYWARNLD